MILNLKQVVVFLNREINIIQNFTYQGSIPDHLHALDNSCPTITMSIEAMTAFLPDKRKSEITEQFTHSLTRYYFEFAHSVISTC